MLGSSHRLRLQMSVLTLVQYPRPSYGCKQVSHTTATDTTNVRQKNSPAHGSGHIPDCLETRWRSYQIKKKGINTQLRLCGGEEQGDRPLLPSSAILPKPGFKEYIPQKEAGIRKLPARSDPIPTAAPSRARRAASPPDDPPHVCRLLQGFVARPQRAGLHSKVSMCCET